MTPYDSCTIQELPPLVVGATTFAPVGSVSLDSQSPAAPYEFSSLATPQVGALWVLGIIVNW